MQRFFSSPDSAPTDSNPADSILEVNFYIRNNSASYNVKLNNRVISAANNIPVDRFKGYINRISDWVMTQQDTFDNFTIGHEFECILYSEANPDAVDGMKVFANSFALKGLSNKSHLPSLFNSVAREFDSYTREKRSMEIAAEQRRNANQVTEGASASSTNCCLM